MAKTISYAAQKWETKTGNAGTIWKAAVDAAVTSGAYCAGFQAFIGHNTPLACAAWTAGVNTVSAADFKAAIAGKRSKYEGALGRVS